MYVAPLSVMDQAPSLGQMLGNARSQECIDQINARWGSNTVAFGAATNPFRDNYAHFMNLVNTQINVIDPRVRDTMTAVFNPNTIREIKNETDLILIPECMQIPMLMMPQMHELMMDRKIYGWDYNPDSLPKEDAYGRILNNGKIEFDMKDLSTLPEYITWEYREDDPELTEEEWDAIERSRRYLAAWIEKEMSADGSRRDPTDVGNCIRA